MSERLLRTLIADDEPVARARLRRMLLDHGDVEVVGEATSGPEAVAALARLDPDLVLLDIEMPGMSGLEVARLSSAASSSRPVIVFVTAYDRFAIDAYTLDAADYLLKPYDAERLAAMLTRVRRRMGMSLTATRIEPREHLVAMHRGEARLLPIGSVERIASADNYVEVMMSGGGRHLVRETLERLEHELPAGFARIARTMIIRIDRIASARSAGHGDLILALHDGSEVRVSRRFRATLASRLPELVRRSSTIGEGI